MSYQNLSRELDLVAAPFLARLVGVYTLTDADVASTGGYPGMKVGTNLYSFVEQTYSPTTGLPVDAAPGRQTQNSLGNVGAQSPLPITRAPTSGWAIEDNNSFLSITNTPPPVYANPGVYVEMRLMGSVLGSPQYEFQALSAFAWVAATSSTPTQVNLGRTIHDGVITGATTLTSATANFTSADTGAIVIGTGIPASTTITFVNSTTATLSHASTNGAGLTVQIITGSVKAYQATLDVQSTTTGIWSSGQTVWLQQANDSAWLPLVGGQEPILVPVVSGQIYQCRYFTTDDNNVPIWTVAEQEGNGITVTDGTTTVTNVTTLKFKVLFTVSSPTGGEADVTPTPPTGFADANGNSNYPVTTSWSTVGSTTPLQITLPKAGTYVIWTTISAILRTSNSLTFILARLFDQTNSTAVGDPAIVCGIASAGSPESDDAGSATIQSVHTVAGSAIIEGQVILTGGPAISAVAQCPDLAGGGGSNCAISYFQIG